jgi:putative transposase
LREDNLLCLRKRTFVVTTDSQRLPCLPQSGPALHTYGCKPTLGRRHHLHSVDITYVRLDDEFVYLAIILDIHSRLIIGWASGCRILAGRRHSARVV